MWFSITSYGHGKDIWNCLRSGKLLYQLKVLVTVYFHRWSNKVIFTFFSQVMFLADSGGPTFYGIGLLPLACWDCGFEFHREFGCLSLMNTLFCPVEISMASRSPIQRSSTECMSQTVVRCNNNRVHIQWEGRKWIRLRKKWRKSNVLNAAQNLPQIRNVVCKKTIGRGRGLGSLDSG
jgi:hypothetical protein